VTQTANRLGGRNEKYQQHGLEESEGGWGRVRDIPRDEQLQLSREVLRCRRRGVYIHYGIYRSIYIVVYTP
jgi:hypothetical protein